jgi:hypothetical protein
VPWFRTAIAQGVRPRGSRRSCRGFCAPNAGIAVAISNGMPRITCSELLARGDLALRTHDTTTLARVMRLLASRVGDPLADRLHHLARACDCQPDDPAREWTALREAIVERLAIAGS